MRDIEHAAAQVLKKLNIGKAPIPIKKIIRQLDIKLNSFDLGDDVSGVLVIEENSPRIGYNPSESNVRQRFTLAHELGHFVLHCNKKQNGLFVDSTKVMFRRQGSTPSELRQERQANAFAAAILMPEDLIKKEYEALNEQRDYLTDDTIVKKLSSIFKVSEIAMTYRLMNLGYIHDNY